MIRRKKLGGDPIPTNTTDRKGPIVGIGSY